MRAGISVAGSALLVSGLLWWGTADLVAGGDPENDATVLVPPDGTRTLDTDDRGRTRVSEQARLTGPEMVLTSPPVVGGALATSLDGDPYTWRIWRTTQTTYQLDEGDSPEQSTTVRRLTDAGIEQLAAYGPFPLVFDPPMLEIPADVHDGATWSGSGSATPDGSLDYESEFSAERADDGCFDVTGNVTFTEDGETLLDSPTDETWCRAQGIVSGSDVDTPVFDGSTAPEVSRADAVDDWVAQALPVYLANDVESADQTGAEASLVVDLPPAATTGQRLAVANGQGHDVLGLVRNDGTMVRAWVGHPGGSITCLAVSGDVTVVGTSERELVAYGDHGQWLWSRRMGDVPVAAPLAVDGGHLVATTVGGEVDAFDPRTGETLWDHSLTDRVSLAPVTDGETVLVADVAGRVAAYDVDSGEQRWAADLDGVLAMAVVDDLLVVRTPDAARAYRLGDGRRLWSARLEPGVSSAAVADLGGTVAVATSEDTVGLTVDDGHERWHLDGADVSLGVDGRLAQISGHRMWVLDADGARPGRWTLDGLRGTSDYVTTSDTGVWVMDAVGHTVEVGR